MRISLAMICVSMLLVMPMTVRATHQDLTDGRDTKGRLDIRKVWTWGPHANTGFRIGTFRSWTPKFIWDRGFFVVNVDTFGTSRFDYYVLIRSNGRRMKGLLFRDRAERRDYVIRKVRVWRPDSKSVNFRFPWGDVRFPKRRRHFRWSAQSLFSSDACPSVCIDRVPNKGTVMTTVRPAPTPTATPTDSPAP
ncbi:MAG: hypothetical protein GEU78_15225 [Actinobacteria bacterium]|nr:hypothetical protein [Actinomycetota bacterium]